MMKKAMASDFDNTLYFMFLDEPYRKGDRESIRDFQQAGGLFGVSTGRSLRGVRQAAGDEFAGTYEENRIPGLRRRNI